MRSIDWKVTARTGHPHVRLHVAERALTTWIVLDVTGSMSFGTQERGKADVAEGVVLALSHVGTSGANRLGLVLAGDRPEVALPPTGDRRRVLRLLSSLRDGRAQHHLRADEDALASGIAVGNRIARRSAAAVVVSDFRGAPSWRRPLSDLARRHHVLAVEVLDPREQVLEPAGELVLVDPETGASLRVDTSDPTVRARFAATAEQERASTRRRIVGTGSHLVTLSTDGDWLRPLAAALSRRRRSR